MKLHNIFFWSCLPGAALIFGMSVGLASADPTEKPTGQVLAVPNEAQAPADKAIVAEKAPLVEDEALFRPITYYEPIQVSSSTVEPVQPSAATVDGNLFRTSVSYRDGFSDQGSGDGVVAAGGVAPVPPASAATVPAKGFYPTREEWRTLGGYYQRDRGHWSPNDAGGPSNGRSGVAVSGLWPYQANPNPSFYERNDGFFSPIERTLGVLSSDTREGINLQGKDWSLTAPLIVDLDIPFLARDYNPERATFRLGPLFIDVLSLSGSVLYSDYTGNIDPQYETDDGWASEIALTLRGVLRLTDHMYLSFVGTVYFLPGDGTWGFHVGEGTGLSLGTGARFVYQHEFSNGWTFQILDRLQIRDYFADLFLWDLDSNEIETSGRYRLGFDNNRKNAPSGGGFFDDSNLYLNNSLDITYSGALSRDWFGRFGVGRDDQWALDGFDYQNGWTSFYTDVLYSGEDWRFAPYFSYNIRTDGEDPNNFDVWRNTLKTGVRGPITQNLRLDANAGYTWLMGNDHNDGDGAGQSWLYEMGLIHEWGPYTTQSLFAGNVIDYDDYGDAQLAKYIRYSISRILGPRIRVRGLIQGSQTDEQNNVTEDQLLTGGALTLWLGDFTQFTGSVVYNRGDYSHGSQADFDRWIYRASLNHRFLPGLYGTLSYQYEDYQESNNQYFDEQLYMLTITKTF